jgi:Tfp pilus assembly protein PilF
MAVETFKEDFMKEFGELNARQLWILARFAKFVRLRARNNTAFNNFCNRSFPYARFEQVQKVHKDGTPYPGLKITVKGQEWTPNLPEDDE